MSLNSDRPKEPLRIITPTINAGGVLTDDVQFMVGDKELDGVVSADIDLMKPGLLVRVTIVINCQLGTN